MIEWAVFTLFVLLAVVATAALTPVVPIVLAYFIGVPVALLGAFELASRFERAA